MDMRRSTRRRRGLLGLFGRRRDRTEGIPDALEEGLIAPLPEAQRLGPGRDRRFALPQKTLNLNGFRTVFFDEGPRDAPVLLFVHGLAGNVTFWVNVAPWFLPECRVVGLDLPGCGETSKPEDGRVSIALFAEHVRALMDALEIERATLVGHSMGGMVVTEFGLRFPERADALVMENPAGFLPLPRLLRLGGEVFLRQTLLNPVLPRVWRFILANVFYHDNAFTEAFVRTVDETYAPDDIYDLSWVMCALKRDLLHLNYFDQLPALSMPVFLQWGSQDRLVPAASFHEAARVLPHVVTDEIPGCGHMPIIERPDRVLAFLERAAGLSNHPSEPSHPWRSP